MRIHFKELKQKKTLQKLQEYETVKEKLKNNKGIEEIQQINNSETESLRNRIKKEIDFFENLQREFNNTDPAQKESLFDFYN